MQQFINTQYSRPAMQLFANCAQLCIIVPDEFGLCAPRIADQYSMPLIAMETGHSPLGGGVDILIGLHEDGNTVHVWDTEIQENAPRCSPEFRFQLAEFFPVMLRYLAGEGWEE